MGLAGSEERLYVGGSENQFGLRAAAWAALQVEVPTQSIAKPFDDRQAQSKPGTPDCPEIGLIGLEQRLLFHTWAAVQNQDPVISDEHTNDA